MSTIPPPDRPTQPIAPVPPDRVVDQRVVAPAVDPNLILLRLEDSVSSLRTGLMLVGVLAVAALAVAIYALVSADEADTRGGSRGLASDARVSQIDDRVDRLSRQVQAARAGDSGSETAALGTRVDAVERTVKTLADRPATDATQAIRDLSGRIDTLARDIDALKQSQPAP